ncbi:hypothetical protein [Citrobacter sp. Marseille-Q6884]|uniref:hypothetical protein n=1 Tax=Citrobacter sp. Marseille-Q6884 TaxID=2956786 RepID=UPI0021B4733D|nr:hypothetical protein [Citrobacter sp. Marseille-Q6884]
MSIKNQIHALLIKHRQLNMKQIISEIGCIRDSARPALCHLKAEGIITVTRIGSRGEKLYRLEKAEPLSIAAKTTIELCKENWRGYHIHKIFGSTSRAAA